MFLNELSEVLGTTLAEASVKKMHICIFSEARL